jgi:hypothetical protein
MTKTQTINFDSLSKDFQAHIEYIPKVEIFRLEEDYVINKLIIIFIIYFLEKKRKRKHRI